MAEETASPPKLTRAQMERLNEQPAQQGQQQTGQGETPAKLPAARQINPTRMKLAEYERQSWVCTAEFGTTIEDVRDEGYFAHIAAKLKPYDHIEVRVDDGTWIAELLVTEAGRNWARTVLLSKTSLTTQDVARTQSEPKFDAAWGGPYLKWCAVRKVDGSRLQDKMASKEDAQAWIAQYERRTATP